MHRALPRLTGVSGVMVRALALKQLTQPEAKNSVSLDFSFFIY